MIGTNVHSKITYFFLILGHCNKRKWDLVAVLIPKAIRVRGSFARTVSSRPSIASLNDISIRLPAVHEQTGQTVSLVLIGVLLRTEEVDKLISRVSRIKRRAIAVRRDVGSGFGVSACLSLMR